MNTPKEKWKYEDDILFILNRADKPLRAFQICRRLLINNGEAFGVDERDHVHQQVKRVLGKLKRDNRVLAVSHITRPSSKYSPTPTVYSIIH